MDVSATTRELLEAKRARGLTFAELGKVIGRDEVWVAVWPRMRRCAAAS